MTSTAHLLSGCRSLLRAPSRCTRVAGEVLRALRSEGVAACRYVLACIETKQGVKRGDRVWQIAFGSGFKCNSAVWRAMRNVNTRHEAWLDLPKSE